MAALNRTYGGPLCQGNQNSIIVQAFLMLAAFLSRHFEFLSLSLSCGVLATRMELRLACCMATRASSQSGSCSCIGVFLFCWLTWSIHYARSPGPHIILTSLSHVGFDIWCRLRRGCSMERPRSTLQNVCSRLCKKEKCEFGRCT